MDRLQTPTAELCGNHLYTVGVWACQHGHLHTTHIFTHTHNPALGAQVDPLQEKWVKMERRKRFNHFSLMVQLSPERLKWEHGALPTAPDCALNHVPRKTHSLHDTKQSQLTVRAEWVYNHNMCLCLPSTSENASPVVVCKCHSKINFKNDLLSAIFEIKLQSTGSW